MILQEVTFQQRNMNQWTNVYRMAFPPFFYFSKDFAIFFFVFSFLLLFLKKVTLYHSRQELFMSPYQTFGPLLPLFVISIQPITTV